MNTTPAKDEDRLRVKLTLEALPNWETGSPAPRRLARALKCLLRSFGFKCLDVEDMAQPMAKVMDDFPP